MRMYTYYGTYKIYEFHIYIIERDQLVISNQQENLPSFLLTALYTRIACACFLLLR
jgi:hypothetical protein